MEYVGDMPEETQQQAEQLVALPRHQYPIVIKIFGVIVGLGIVTSLLRAPAAFRTIRNFRAAEKARAAEDYKSATLLYNDVLQKVPTSAAAKKGLARAYFANGTEEDDLQGLILLKDLKLSRSEWSELQQAAPEKIRFFLK